MIFFYKPQARFVTPNYPYSEVFFNFFIIIIELFIFKYMAKNVFLFYFMAVKKTWTVIC